MRLVQVLVVLVALLACGVAAKQDSRNLLSAENEKTSKGKEDRHSTIDGETVVFSTAPNGANIESFHGGTIVFSTTPNGANIESFHGGTIVFSTTPNEDNGGGTVTVKTYNNDGIWERIKKWWKKLIGREERLRPADARSAGFLNHLATGGRASNVGTGGIASRVGTGGTVAISDNNKGGGTVTVTVFNNNGLFQRVKRWWERIFARVTSGSPQRLRQLV